MFQTFSRPGVAPCPKLACVPEMVAWLDQAAGGGIDVLKVCGSDVTMQSELSTDSPSIDPGVTACLTALTFDTVDLLKQESYLRV